MKNMWVGRERQTERDRETQRKREEKIGREETGDSQEEFTCGNRDLSAETGICTFHLNLIFL